MSSVVGKILIEPAVRASLLVLLSACSDPPRAPVPVTSGTPAPTACSPTAPAARAPERPPSVGSRVFVDVSGSMRGFIRRGDRTVSAIQQALDDSLGQVGRPGPRRCTVGETVECEAAPSNSLAYDSPDLYRAETSRLDLVLTRAPVPEQIDPDHPPAPDPLDDASVTIVVTDGMQNAGEAAGTGTGACQGRADPACIASLLAARAREGFGVWLVRQQLAFAGTHFAERPLSAVFLEQSAAHAAEIALEPRYNGVEFSVGRLSTDTREGTSSFRYEGLKSLLLVVLARDPALGRSFVENLVTRLRSLPIHPGSVQPSFAVQSVELAPLSASAVELTGLASAPDEQQRDIAVELRRELRVRDVTVASGTVRAEIRCGARGRQFLAVSGQASTGPGAEMVAITRTIEGPSGAPPNGVLPAEPLGEGASIAVNCTPFRPGVTEVSFTHLQTASVAEATFANGWWSEASADDTYVAPERIYGLSQIVRSVLEVAVARHSRQQCLVLAIDREG